MVLWFAGCAVAIVWSVFRDRAVDYRLVVVGVLTPELIDLPTGRPHVAHTLIAPVVVLALVMARTRGRRAQRRQLLAFPIGWFLHLVLSGVWASPEALWWPALGTTFPDDPLWPRPAVGLLLEVAGAWALGWFVWRFGLTEPHRRRLFLATGRLPAQP